MSFQQGLSGLNAAAKSLDVIGNNVANASTVGFKSSQAQFADVYASSLTGAGGNAAGIGTKVTTIAQQFTQGNISSSNNPLDIAINGGGFFRLSVNGTINYTRNGQFQLDKQGYMVNANQAKVTGYIADAKGVLSTGAPTELRINTADLAPLPTSKIDTKVNLDSRQLVPITSPLDVTDPTSYNSGTSVNVYDSLGNPHVMQQFFVKTAPSTWQVYLANDGTEVTNLAVAGAVTTDAPTQALALAKPFDAVNYALAAGQVVQTASEAAGGPVGTTTIQDAANAAAAITGSTPDSINAAILAVVKVPPVPVADLMFTPTGAIDLTALSNIPPGPPGLGPQSAKHTINLPIFPATGSVAPLTAVLDYTGTTQFGANFGVNSLSQDGYTAGRLSGFNTGSDGTIVGRYTNGKSNVLAQIVMANFVNPNGLSALGNNVFAETSDSGSPLVGVPNSGSLGVLQSSATEESNVDLTAELVQMITAQRVYQANAQTIKTQDQVLQTLVNLR